MISEKRFFELIDAFPSINPILVLGDVGVDKYSFGSVNRISPEAPVPILEVEKEWMKLGLAANVSDNLKSLGAKSTLCSVIGDDKNAQTLEDLLEDSGLSTWGLVRDESRHTTFKERVVTDSQQICRIDYETKTPISESTQKRLLSRISELEEKNEHIILEDYAKGVVTKDFCEKLFSSAKELGKKVSVDPSRSTPPLWYKGAYLLKPNQVESKKMIEALGYQSRDLSTQQMANILVEKLDLKKVIITLGAKGMGMIDTENKGQYMEIPTVAREVFDVSGAGDTAISAIVSSLAAGANLEEATWVGNCASGVVVGKKGTALVSPQELRDFYKKLKNTF